MSGRATRHVHAHALDQGTRVLPQLPASRRLCLACARRRPRFRYRGVVKTDADHTLCFQCYRAQVQRSRAVLMVSAWRQTPMKGSWPQPSGLPSATPQYVAPHVSVANRRFDE